LGHTRRLDASSRYTLFTSGEASAAGLINLPPDAKKLGAALRWIGYVSVDDVDAIVDRLKQLDGFVSRFSELKEISLSRLRMSAAVRGVSDRSRGLICTKMES
jgi:hypothetical protein